MKPINYYIQLSDEASSHIDALDKRSLLAMAREALDCEMQLIDNDTLKDVGHTTIFPINGYHVTESLTATQLATLAYGCLARATF
jgi:hypothetical protein